MIKKYLMGVLLLITLVFSGCEGINESHVWGEWLADVNGNTHTRICEEDFTHTETENHLFELTQVIEEASDLHNGCEKYTCKECGYEKLENTPPTGKHNFTLELEKEECLKKHVSSATAVYYKSCSDCGAYGNDNYLFEKTSLPEKYLEIEYAESNGDKYVDTGFKANNKTRLVIKASYTKNYSIYGGTPGCLNFTAQSPSIGYFYSGGYDNGVSQKVDLSRKVHVFEQNRNKVYVDGELFHTFNYIEWQDKNSLYLFARNKNGIPDDMGGIVRIYSFMLYDNDILIRDFVPVVDLDTDEIGFYDLITEKFYSNKHGFTAGDKVEESTLPSEYTEVEYIEGSGQQYINTEVIYDDSDIEVDVSFSFNKFKGASTVFGCQISKTNLLIRERNGKLVLFHKNYNTTIGELELNKRYDINIKVSDTYAEYSGTLGEKSNVVSSEALVNGLPIYLFDSCHAKPDQRGSSYSSEISSDMKLYSCIIRKNGEIVRNFIPCVRNIDSLAGLYDVENNRFYTYTQGFNFGDITGTSYKDGLYQSVEYIESNGSQYIDTGFVPTSGNMKIKMKGRYIYPADNQSWFGVDEGRYGLNAAHTADIWQFANGGTWCNFSDSTLDTSTHEIECYYGSSNQYIKIDGETKYSGSEYQISASKPMTLFCNTGRYGNGVRENRYFTAGELYYFKIYNNDILVRDFVPVVNTKTGEPGLYDLIGEKFYTNANDINLTGGEIAGHDFDNGVVIKEVSYSENGDTLYTCNVCGRQIHKVDEAYSYKINFEIDENIEEIRVFRDYDPSNYESSLIAYSINKNTFNYSKVNSIIIIDIICKSGYEIDKAIYDSDIEITILEDGRYVISNIHSNQEIIVISKAKE